MSELEALRIPTLWSLLPTATAVLFSFLLACGTLHFTAVCLFKHTLTHNFREMAVGNTFGATALSSYGGFWLSFAIILTPGGFEIESALVEFGESYFLNSFGLYLMGWFIFTFILLVCTLKSTVAFFSLFFTLDLAFLLLGVGYLNHSGGEPNPGCIKAGGYFALFAAFLAWYNALAGIADNSNRLVATFLFSAPSLLHIVKVLILLTASSSSPSRTSPGRRRAARCAARLTRMSPRAHKPLPRRVTLHYQIRYPIV